MTTTPESPAPVTPAKEDTTVALLAYITPIFFGIGIVIAIVMHNSKKTKLGAYHLRQALGLVVASIAVSVAFMVVSFVLHFIPFAWVVIALIRFAIGIGILALMVMGVMAASNREMKPLPVVGAYFEKWFGTTFD